MHWKQLIQRLAPLVQWKLQCKLTDQFEIHLDACHGACLLRRRELAQIVAESLLKFSGDRYELTDFVVMPNHVHLLAAFPDEDQMIKQCSNWKRFTARKINAATAKRNEFWQQEAFDHLVRSPEHFEHYRKYIAENGSRANLPTTDYLAYSN
jgi:type I restriction enzyme R subunit